MVDEASITKVNSYSNDSSTGLRRSSRFLDLVEVKVSDLIQSLSCPEKIMTNKEPKDEKSGAALYVGLIF